MKSLPLAAAATIALGLTPACERIDASDPVATPSPNASILPAPLASAPPRAESSWSGRDGGHPGLLKRSGGTAAAAPSAHPTENGEAGSEHVDAGDRVPPRPFRTDEAIAPDVPNPRDAFGLSLEAEWRPFDLPAPARSADQNPAGLEAARKATTLRWRIDLAGTGKMRVLFSSRAFTVESGSELRARVDRLGHLLVWPDGRDYRVLPPGAVRTLLAERRTDAIPLVPVRASNSTLGQRRLGLPTRRWELSTRTGKLAIEQAKLPQSGEAGALLCRLLVELIAADPLSAPCSAEEVPMRAQYSWPQLGGGISFEVTAMADRLAAAASQLLVPPPDAELAQNRLPTVDGVLLGREELASFRMRPTDGPVSPGALTAPDDGGKNDGLLATNGTDLVRFVLVDGIPVAAVSPGRGEQIIGLPRGRFTIQWRTFLGDSIDPPSTVDVPGRIAIGLSGDAGTSR